MSELEFIKKDPEQILIDTIDLFEQKAGKALNEADPERMLIDCMAYREVLLRNAMEWLMRQNFVQLAEGVNLDYWGGLFGVLRVVDETDNSYRTRILEANKSEGLGTKTAYKSRILSLANVADVLLYTKNDEPDLKPGHVRVVPLLKITEGGNTRAVVHTAALEAEILEAILVDDFGVVGNVFQFTPAVPVAIDGTITVRTLIGYDLQQFQTNIEYQVARYFGDLSLSFSAQFKLTDLSNYIMNAAGISSIVNLSFPSVPILESEQFYTAGNVVINIE